MIHAKVTRGADNKILSAQVLTENEVAARHTIAEVESRWDWRTLDAAREVAKALGEGYIATDSGPNVSPRFDVIKIPAVGDEVSYTFNGDYYPCGKITSISKTRYIITTSEGQKFYRRGESGKWIMSGTWALIPGHHSRLSPEF